MRIWIERIVFLEHVHYYLVGSHAVSHRVVVIIAVITSCYYTITCISLTLIIAKIQFIEIYSRNPILLWEATLHYLKRTVISEASCV